MGLLGRLSGWLGVRRQESQIVVVGLDNSGKSTILQHLKPVETRANEQVPTVGFNVEKFQTRHLAITAFDMSGQGRYRNLWDHYYKDADGIIFVVDCTDRLRTVVAKSELDQLLQHSDIRSRKVPIVFLANKMDVAGCMSALDVSRGLQLERLSDRPWHCCATCGLTGEGLSEAMDWLGQYVKEFLDSKG